MTIIEFLWSTIGTILLIVTCAWALWYGGKAERWGGAILLIGWFLTPIVQSVGPEGPGTGLGYVLVDTAALIAFVILSLWSRRLWTIFISAFQLNAVASHFAGALTDHVNMYTLITALGLWGGYGLTFALAYGTWDYTRRQKRFAAIQAGLQ